MGKIDIQSKIFGLFEMNGDDIIRFEQGIPGLEKVKEYAMVRIEEYEPIIWMISVDGIYHFPLVKVETIDESDFDEDSKNVFLPHLNKLLNEKANMIAYAILKLDDSVKKVRIQSPILIDALSHTGTQLIFDEVKAI